MNLFTQNNNLTTTRLWKNSWMIMVIGFLTAMSGQAVSGHLASLSVESDEDVRPFITIWKTDNSGVSEDNQIIIPTDPSEELALVYNYEVYWEEVDSPTNNGSAAGLTGDYTIDFPAPGTYRVEIMGQFPKIYFNNTGDKSKILSVEQWGDIVWEDMRFAFRGCDEISIDAEDAPDLSKVTDMWGMFWGSSINQNINHWDVSNVINIGNLFRDAKLFNQPLDQWDVSNVTNMPQVFMNAESFNQDIGNWDVSNVTNMGAMFNGAINFNQDIGSWNVGQVDRMNAMFQGAISFNQNIGNWDVSNVLRMDHMFSNATNFNQDIGGWNVNKVSQINHMFNNAVNFNGDIGQWNISSTTDLRYLFMSAISFNQDLSNWNVSHVTNMTYMFYNTLSFDQDLSNWDVSNVEQMNYMLKYSGLSPVHYDALLMGWLANGVQDDIINFHVHGLSYCEGEEARNVLINQHGWKFSGDSHDCSQAITFNTLAEKTYGDPDFKLEGSVSSGAPIIYTSSNPNVAIVEGDSLKIVGAGVTTITAEQPGDDYYSSATPIGRELKVNKAEQTIIFEPLEDKIVGDESFELIASVNSDLVITFSSSDETVATVEGNVVTIVGAGTTIITASQVGNTNYKPAQPVEQTLQVNKRPQAITFDAIAEKNIGDGSFELVAFSDSELAITFVSADETVATIEGSTVTIVGVGSTIITASQPGNVEFEPAEPVLRELVVTKVPQVITFEPLMDMPSDAPDFEINAFASSGLEVVLSISGPATLEGRTVSLKGTSGMVSITATQEGDDFYSAAEPVVRTFEALAAPVTGVQDLLKEGIAIYPNPVHEHLAIELNKESQAIIYVSDAGGNVVLEKSLKPSANQLDFSSLSSGLYFIKIQFADKVLYQKVVKK